MCIRDRISLLFLIVDKCWSKVKRWIILYFLWLDCLISLKKRCLEDEPALWLQNYLLNFIGFTKLILPRWSISVRKVILALVFLMYAFEWFWRLPFNSRLFTCICYSDINWICSKTFWRSKQKIVWCQTSQKLWHYFLREFMSYCTICVVRTFKGFILCSNFYI